MSLCIVCGASSAGGCDICVYHIPSEETWAGCNRIMCDFVHRAIVPRRLPPNERDEIVTEGGAEAFELVES